MRTSRRINLNDEDRVELERIVRSPTTEQRVALRGRIVLLSAEGVATGSIVERLGTTTSTITRWRERYEKEGVAGLLKDAPRSGRKPTITKAQVIEVVRRTLDERPAGATHWSTRTLAPTVGLSPATVGRIWRAHGLKPHRVKRFKLSTDPRFIEKLQDVVGLYLNPPEKAIIFSVDEKSQIQALDRTQPGLPMKKGRAGTMTHDYKRNGTTTLFAALNVATGEVIGECMDRHRHDEFLLFLKRLDRETPKALDLEVILDNYATHKHRNVTAWLAKHPRIHLHFTPTSASWLNLVERFFAEITDKAIRRGVFKHVRELEAAIEAYLAVRNARPAPYTWTATVVAIVEKIARANSALDRVRKSLAISDAVH
jgi:transposase